MPAIALALLPDLLLLATGGLLRRRLPEAGWQAMDALNFRLLFPALIFTSALRSPLSIADLGVIGPGVWAGMLLACGLGWLVRGLGPARFLDFAGMWQTSWRFNAAIAVVAAQALPPECRGLMAVAIGLAVPFANLLAILALSRGSAADPRATLRQLLANPFLLASVAGLALALLRVELPSMLAEAAARLGQAAVPMALLSIGAAADRRALAGMDRCAAALSAIKLLVLPAATLAGATLLGLGAAPALTLTVFAALPTASAAHVLAAAYGADRERVAALIAQSTLLGCVTLPLWLMALL